MRKRILFFLIAMSVSLAAVSQEDSTTVYRSIFGDSVTTWEGVVNVGGIEVIQQYIESYTIDNIENGDTIFHRIKLSEMGYSDYLKENGFVRENQNHSRLYFASGSNYSGLSYREILIMDLSLGVGDTLNTEGWEESGCRYFPKKITVDSVFFIDGRKYIRTNYTRDDLTHIIRPSCDTLYFVEGIGPSMGLFYPFIHSEVILPFITCYKINEELNYTLWPFDGECVWSQWVGGISSMEDLDIKINPNPTSGIVRLSKEESLECTVKVVSVTGETMIDLSLPSGLNETEIDVSHLPKGIYILKVNNCKKSIEKKLVKL